MVGAFAEQVAVDDGALQPLPEGVDWRGSGVRVPPPHCLLHASAPRPPPPRATGWWCWRRRRVGLAAVDLAVAMGARVIAAASSPRSSNRAGSVARRSPSTTAARTCATRSAATGGAGAKVVLDPVGGLQFLNPALRWRCGGTRSSPWVRRRRDPGDPAEPRVAQRNHRCGMEIRTFSPTIPSRRCGTPPSCSRCSPRAGAAVHRGALSVVGGGGGDPRGRRPQSPSARSSSTSSAESHLLHAFCE